MSKDGAPPDGPHGFGGAPPPGSVPSGDPYLGWALSTNFQYLGGKPKWIPLLIELKDVTCAEFADLRWTTNQADGEPLVRVPDHYRGTSSGLGQSKFCMAWVKPDPFIASDRNFLTNEFFSNGVKQYEFGLPIVPLAPLQDSPHLEILGPGGPAPSTATLNVTVAPRRVIVGIIDDGLAFAHERFQLPGGDTRIEYLWIQDMGMGGAQLTAKHINGISNACKHAGLVDETEVYRVAGLENYASAEHKAVGRHRAHGTHVMDIAAGFDAACAPDDRPIVAVQLPGRIVRDTSGAKLTPYVLNGIRYILERANDLAARDGTGPLPVVINISYGLFAGPHDGTSPLEKGIEDLVLWRKLAAPNVPFCVVLPAGNNYLWRTHAQFDLGSLETKELHWRVVPDDRTPSWLEIWLPDHAGPGPHPQVQVRVTSPTGIVGSWINEGDSPVAWPPSKPTVEMLWRMTYDSAVNGTRARIVVTLAPTAAAKSFNPSESIAPSGLWKVEVSNVGPGTTIDAWIQRDDTPFGWPILGRQSYFEDRRYQRFDAYGRDEEADNPATYIKRAGTINSVATSGSTVVVGGCRRSDLKPAKYSAAGPIVPRGAGLPLPRIGFDPDALAISDDSVACQGVLAAGTRSNSVFAMNGTSVAAPQITRWIARQMLLGLQDGRDDTQALAAAEEKGHVGRHPPAMRSGAGRIVDQLPPGRVVRWEP